MRSKTYLPDNDSIPFIVIGLVVLLLVGFVITDTVTGHKDGSYSTVIDRQYFPAHTELSTRYDHNLEMLVTETTHIPDKWVIKVNYKDNVVGLDVSENFYYKISLGDTLPVTSWVGGITGGNYSFRVENAESN
jgi:hypothetical protein